MIGKYKIAGIAAVGAGLASCGAYALSSNSSSSPKGDNLAPAINEAVEEELPAQEVKIPPEDDEIEEVEDVEEEERAPEAPIEEVQPKPSERKTPANGRLFGQVPEGAIGKKFQDHLLGSDDPKDWEYNLTT